MIWKKNKEKIDNNLLKEKKVHQMKDLVTQIKAGKKEAILEVEVILDKKKTKKMLYFYKTNN